MQTNVRLVCCSLPDSDTARKLARSLIESHLAACVKILPNIMTTYQWDQKLQEDTQTVLMIKTTVSAFEKLCESIVASHPDECPEIIACPVSEGFPAYLKWVEQQTCPDAAPDIF